jgi:hypothetical protein
MCKLHCWLRQCTGFCSAECTRTVCNFLILSTLVSFSLHILFTTLRDTLETVQVQPITIRHTGQLGRPQKVLNARYLHAAFSPKRGISISRLARLIEVHRHTLRKYLCLYNVDYSFSNLPDEDLDKIVRAYQQSKPTSGLRYLVGFLRRQGLHIRKSRVICSANRIDPLGQILCRQTTIHYREYQVSRPNALWHMDGHHKLIRWGIVVHGIANGFDRVVGFLLHSLLINLALLTLQFIDD